MVVGDHLILVGRLGAPHGVRGEVRVQSFTAQPLALAGYSPLRTAAGTTLSITSARLLKDNLLIARLKGVSNRDAAAALTNLELFVERAILPPPDDEEFYVADLIGMTAVDPDGKELGTIVAVPNYGGGDLVELSPSTGGETQLFAFTKDVVPTIDLAARRLIIVPPLETAADIA